MIKLIILDWDGTLVDSKSYLVSIAKYIYKKYNFNVYDFIKLHKITYMKFEELVELIHQIKGIKKQGIYENLIKASLRKVYKIKFRLDLRRLEQFSDDFKIGIVTNNDHRIPKKRLKFKKIKLDFLYGSQDFPDKTKAIEHVLKKYNIKKKECIFVGDSPSDMNYAKSVGVYAIWYPNIYFNPITTHPEFDYKISNTEELIEIMYSL